MAVRKLLFLCLFTIAFLWASDPIPLYFQGNRHIPADKLYEVVGVPKPLFFEFWKPNPRIDPDKVRALLPAIEGYYKSMGFYHAKAEAILKGDKIIIRIDEGPRIHVADVAVISKLPIRSLIPFKKGSPFTAQAFSESKKRILKYYRNHHYCNVHLKAKAYIDIEKNLAYLVYDVTPGQTCVFGRITIHPPKNVEARIIRSLLHFSPGMPYSKEAIRRSYLELYANEGVERVIIDDNDRNGSRVPVDVTVTTYDRPLHLTLGGGFDSDEGLSLQAALKHRNFFGNLHTFGIEARYTQVRRYLRFAGDMPLAHHNRVAGRLGIRQERFDGYDENALTARLDLKHNRMPHYFTESLIFDRSEVRHSSDPVQTPNDTLSIMSLRADWIADTRDSILDPTRGYRLELAVQGAIKGIVSDASYLKSEGSFAWDHPLHGDVVAARIHAGSIEIASGRIPPSYRFYAGGMNSNRAWNYRDLGPKNRAGDPMGALSLVESTLEWRHLLSPSFRGVVFTDLTWLGEEGWPDFGVTYPAVGVGIRYLSPMGPIAFDIGVDPKDYRRYAIHFHIGELF